MVCFLLRTLLRNIDRGERSSFHSSQFGVLTIQQGFLHHACTIRQGGTREVRALQIMTRRSSDI